MFVVLTGDRCVYSACALKDAKGSKLAGLPGCSLHQCCVSPSCRQKFHVSASSLGEKGFKFYVNLNKYVRVYEEWSDFFIHSRCTVMNIVDSRSHSHSNISLTRLNYTFIYSIASSVCSFGSWTVTQTGYSVKQRNIKLIPILSILKKCHQPVNTAPFLQCRFGWSVVYSRNAASLCSLRLIIFDKSHRLKKQTLEKKQKKHLLFPQRALLVPSILLPAHFMPLSALIDVKIVLQIRGISMCVCLSLRLFACSTHLLICVRVCVILVCLLFCFNALSLLVRWTFCLNYIWAVVQPGHIT